MRLCVVPNLRFSLFYCNSTVRAICHNYYSSLPQRTHSRKTHSIPNRAYNRCAMATAARIKLSLSTPGVFHVPNIAEESAAKASEVLQENHENHHIFFNKAGFHSRFRSFSRISCSGILKSSACRKCPHALCLRTTRIFLRMRALRSRTKSDFFSPTS